MQKTLDLANQGLPLEKQIHIRIALNLGQGIIKGGDVFGDVVNTASRIEHLADANQIVISEELYQQIKDRPDLPCRFLKSALVKGKQNELSVYEVLWTPISAPA